MAEGVKFARGAAVFRGNKSAAPNPNRKSTKKRTSKFASGGGGSGGGKGSFNGNRQADIPM